MSDVDITLKGKVAKSVTKHGAYGNITLCFTLTETTQRFYSLAGILQFTFHPPVSSLKCNFLFTFIQPMFLLEPDSNKETMYVRHCAVSSIENGHKKVITDIHWLPDSFEVSLDGHMGAGNQTWAL